MQAAKRIGPGSKLRHLDVSEFYIYIQGALQARELGIGKVKGLWNPANFLTKHPKTGADVRAALPSLGMLERDGEYKRINVKVAKVSEQDKTWKPQMLASLLGAPPVRERRDGTRSQPPYAGRSTFS